MKKGLQPNTENRHKLLRLCKEKNMSAATVRQLVEPMRGKTDEEKEHIAKQLLQSIETM